jgi:hypothetical protein
LKGSNVTDTKRKPAQQKQKKSPLKLSRYTRGIPASSYLLPTDGKKWKPLCNERKALADWLATYGDGDGTRIFPSIDTMQRAFDTMSRRTLFRRLKDLQSVGILKSEGLHGERGSRIRRLNPSDLDGPKPPTDFLKAGLDAEAEVPNRTAGMPKPADFGTRPSPDDAKSKAPVYEKGLNPVANIEAEPDNSQITYFWELAHDIGWTQAEVNQILVREFGTDKLEGLSPSDFKNALDIIDIPSRGLNISLEPEWSRHS